MCDVMLFLFRTKEAMAELITWLCLAVMTSQALLIDGFSCTNFLRVMCPTAVTAKKKIKMKVKIRSERKQY